jgi:uncharacterized membrane protein (DUF4010 family)
MLGALAGLSGWLFTIEMPAAAIALLAGAVAIIIAAYAAASKVDVDATTEIAGLTVVGAGLVAGLGLFQLASGIFALLNLILIEKSRLHSLVARIDDVSLRAAVRFGVMALVVLPLLPRGPYGPFGGVRPRELWAIVLFFSGLSFAGYVARRLVGPQHGYFLTGLLGGVLSSTNVTFTFGRLSRHHPTVSGPLAFGAVAANAMLFPRVLVATAVLNTALVPLLIPYFVGPAIVASAIAAIGAGRFSRGGSDPDERRNPLQLVDALGTAALFQIVLVAVHLARSGWGESGVLTSAAILGLTDVDALTMSMAREVGTAGSHDLAARAIAIGVLANTFLKLLLALVFGSASYRLLAGGTLTAMIVVATATIVAK